MYVALKTTVRGSGMFYLIPEVSEQFLHTLMHYLHNVYRGSIRNGLPKFAYHETKCIKISLTYHCVN
jgi:hypothetical protein